MKMVQRVSAHCFVIFLGVGMFFVQGPSFVYHLSDRVADAGDSLINCWILAWNAHALVAPGMNVWDAPFYYPVKNTFTFSETMFGNLWLTLPVQFLTGNPTLAFNALVLGSFVLGMYCTFLLVGSLTGNFVAGVVAGIVFSFSPYRWADIPHAQLLPFFWAPLGLLLAHRFLETNGKRHLPGLFAVLVVQYYTSIYLGTILVITTVTFAVVHVLAERRGKDRFVWFTDPRLLTTLLGGGALAALALAPLVLPYTRTARAWGFVRTQADNASFSCEPLSYLVPNPGFRSYQWLYYLFEGQIRGYCGLGVTPWLLALGGILVARRRPQTLGTGGARVVKRFAWTALVMAVLMLGPCLILLDRQRHFPLPYFLVYHLVPGAKALRVPTRFILPLLLCLAVLGGFAVAQALHAWRRWRPVTRALIGAASLALFALDYAVTDNSGVVCEPRAQFPPVYAYLAAGEAGRPVLELPASLGGQFRYLYYQTAHWRPLLGGESGSFTPAALEMAKRTQGPPTDATLRFLELTPAQTLVIHLNACPGAVEQWRGADLTRYGFRRVGQFGEALVWERVQPLPDSSSRLRVVRGDFQFSKALLEDRLDISLVLSPGAGGRPWRYLERGLADLTIEVVGPQGEVQRYTKPFAIPPYLLPGETAAVRLDKVRGRFAGARRVRIRGPLVEGFEAEVAPGMTATASKPYTIEAARRAQPFGCQQL
jgi:hypothetical protein